jgi:hypothetical protein
MRRLLTTTLLMGVIPMAAGAERPSTDLAQEYRFKAAFLYNVLKFVTWPDSAFDGEQGPVVVTVLGQGVSPHVEQVLNDKIVQGRPLVVRSARTPKDIGACHALFISSDASTELHDALESVAGRPVLTVSEVDAPSTPVVLRLAVKDAKFTFEVDLDAAEAAALKLSANLLDLAAKVRSSRLKRGKP